MSFEINAFIKRCAEAYLTHKSLAFVLGNEGGDMDSTIGSIYLAFYLEKCDMFGLKNYMPVLNFEKEDLPLRNDIIKFFSRHGVSTEHIYSVKGEVGSPHFIEPQKITSPVILYDHNKLSFDQSCLSELITGIVDHHADEKMYVKQTDRLRIIEATGSACTLVAELFREHGLQVPSPELLLGPIVLDTVNFDPAQKKVTERDIMSAKWLMEQGNLCCDLTSLFTELSEWKMDIRGLSISQHLRRDYKGFDFPFKESAKGAVRVGISSIPCRFDELLEYSNADPVLECLEFNKSRALETLLLTFSGRSHTGGYNRQLAFLAKGDMLMALRDYSQSFPDNIEFSLIYRATVDQWTFEVHDLSDPSVSRKKLSPSLSGFLSSWRKH
ncbi:DHH family DHHA2 domain [Trypanosoma vivax]|nr:putative acidocalcisomal exopolyphosphatase [Trypanosoma vivax]KAH8618739.1 DHH family DHHA2 domain [Trypanosoma vivax]